MAKGSVTYRVLSALSDSIRREFRETLRTLYNYKWRLGLFLPGLVALFLFPFLQMDKQVRNSPEREYARLFALDNPAVSDVFGPDLEVVPLPIWSFRFQGKDSQGGYFQFRVNGSRESGEIKTYWSIERESVQFKVVRISHVTGFLPSEETIWREDAED